MRLPVAIVCLATGVLVIAGPARLEAQTLVPDEPTCPECRIAMELVVRLDPAALLPTSPSRVSLDSDGRYWLTFGNDAAMVFDSSGRFLHQLPEGEGPGEFQYPSVVVHVGDSIVVFDRAAGPSIVGPDLRVTRTLQPSRLGGDGFALVWPDSLLLTNGNLWRSGNCSPFHVVSLVGQSVDLIRSFGQPEDVQCESGERPNLVRLIARSQDGGVWAFVPQRYTLNRWSIDGDLRQTLIRRPSWFPDEPPPMNFSRPPPPHVRALRQGAEGRLWVFVSVAAPTWREGYPDAGPGVGDISPAAFSNEKLYDTTVEVLDPASERVIVRAALDRYLISPLPGGLAALYDTTEAGEPYVEIVRLVISR